ncbi:MAG: chromosomal replication initiator protein DnaA, partial [Patescibacteria group bacterium]
VEGIRNKTTQSFRNKYRKLQGLLIDDIQFIAGKDSVQEEFFHTFNAVTQAGGQVILTSDRPPSEIAKLEERLRSRFEAGLIVDIGQPDFELRCAITQIKSKDRGLELPMDLVQVIASNIESARKIEGFLTRLVSEVKLKNLPVSEDLIKSILSHGQEMKQDQKRLISADSVIEKVCNHFSISKRAMLSKTRTRTIARPRQMLMYILRTDLGMPFEEVGKMIGGRDHTTVMHAVDTITRLVTDNPKIREDIMGIKNSL